MMVRLSARVIAHLSGSSAWQQPKMCLETGYERADVVQMMDMIKAAKSAQNGSVRVDLTIGQRRALWEYMDVMAISARDNLTPPGDPDGADALADYNAARAMMRQLERGWA